MGSVWGRFGTDLKPLISWFGPIKKPTRTLHYTNVKE